MSRPESPLKPGDKMSVTRQSDGSYNVVVRLVAPDGDETLKVANVSNPSVWARTMRHSVSNPPVYDPAAEMESLIEQRDVIDARLVEIGGPT